MKRVLSLSFFLLSAVVSCTTVRPTRAVTPSLVGGESLGDAKSQDGTKPLGGSWDAGVSLFRQARPDAEADALKNETYLEICDPGCELPGLFGDDVAVARGGAVAGAVVVRGAMRIPPRITRVAGLNGSVPPEGISYLEAANDFANRFNRAVFARFHPR